MKFGVRFGSAVIMCKQVLLGMIGQRLGHAIGAAVGPATISNPSERTRFPFERCASPGRSGRDCR